MKKVTVGISALVFILLIGTSWGLQTRVPTPAVPQEDISENLAAGIDALSNVTTGSKNTTYGAKTLSANLGGAGNTAIGHSALTKNTVSDNNTAVGASALASNETGGDNVATGANALVSNVSGSSNIAVGFGALRALQTGSNNIAIGAGALSTRTGGSQNIAIGSSAGSVLTTGTNNIYIGTSVGASGESNTIRLGSNTHTRTFIGGISNAVVSGNTVVINTQGRLGIVASSARYKRDIQTMGTRSQGLLQLRPVTFHYKQDVQQLQYGLIAEEVAKVYPELVTRDDNGEVQSVMYHELTPMLLNELQHQHGQLILLKAENERLRARDAAMTERLERLEAAVAQAAKPASR